MRYYSTRSRSQPVSFAAAVLSGLAPDGGLFVPEEIPHYNAAVLNSLDSLSFLDIAFETIRPFVHPEIPDNALEDLVSGAFTFPAPVVPVAPVPDGGRFVLELFHGPTAAFKDFGARFMARAFAYLRRGETKPLKILVATSGDTGGAVASGFFGVEGITVTVLYPQGRVSPLQEKQIAGLGGNISAIAVEGSFDDCQHLVKAAFADKNLRQKLDMSSANSINIARLIPQAIYYTAGAAAFSEPKAAGSHPVFCVPSGNFGNLTAGLYAQKMGAPVAHFIAATNINKTFPDYLAGGAYKPRPSEATISNAMDVGAPSNFERMQAHWNLEEMRRLMTGIYITDEETRATIKEVHEKYGYFLDPHGAVGWNAAAKLAAKFGKAPVVVLETAHPAKFSETVEPITGPIPMPPQLAETENRAVRSITIPADSAALAEAITGG